MLRYTWLRAGLFVVCFAVIWGLVDLRVLPAGLGSSNLLWVLLLSLVITAPLSYVLLRGVRDDASAQISQRIDRSRAAFAAKKADEDEADDAARTG
ncbi:DUF4229 domain-containing protein [Streptomyces sp. SL13]|jgi:hypothetical protein|uniref:DUF4229 domain-containing protein n=1 Tax=Streptantibioticus silvisoli TaxID=2705255 RepID=A0AA90H5G0_9ACTN|nr:DUF4229 domain-containing protein [Streptantibioticus silvisoli]MDI5966566.1 DUF4229 domain-containing protein [Streptantibioticus silvisoli]MDI5972276.1 DUF4229 domain-containing protein [Streptantibioticus silvisoli]